MYTGLISILHNTGEITDKMIQKRFRLDSVSALQPPVWKTFMYIKTCRQINIILIYLINIFIESKCVEKLQSLAFKYSKIL